MTAIILAAGYGRRMRPLSDHTHKALLPVGGSTILGRIVDGLRAIGVDDLVIVTGYRADDVRAFMAARHAGVRVRFVHNAHYDTTNNIVSLSLAFGEIRFDDDVVVVECDLLFDAAVLRALRSPEAGNIALVDRYRPGMDGTVVAVQDGTVTQVFPPHLQGPNFQYEDKFKTLNIYRFDREFCTAIFKPLLDCYATMIDGNAYYELVLGMLVNMQRQPIRAVVAGGAWAEVDDPNDLASARFQFEPDRRAEVLDHALGGHWNFDVTDFAFMRNHHFPTDALVAAMRQALPAAMASYGSAQVVLNQKMAWWLGCEASRLQVLHGASQIYPVLRRVARARRVLRPEPSFGEYARMFPDAATYLDAPGIDLEALDGSIRPGDVVVIVTPNSPTGTVVPTGWVMECARRHPHALFVVDESFIDFSGERSMIARLEDDPVSHVLVIKSLSKSLGVPGLRLGCVYCANPEIVRIVGDDIPIWNLSGPAEFYLEQLLKYRPDFDRSLERTRADRAQFAAMLEALPPVARVHTGGGNFLLVELRGAAADAARIRSALLARFNIDVKDVSARFAGAGAKLRIAVRRPEDNARFCEALAGVA